MPVASPHLVMAFGLPGGSEWLWIFLIALLLFGGARLPSVMRGLGGSIKEFKKGMEEGAEPPKKAPGDAPEGTVRRDQPAEPADKK